MDNIDNERDELIKRFADSLKKPAIPTDFDEQDLIEIFDYAGDLNNDFIRMEVLLRGSRFFPESRELSDRRGILYDELLSQEDVDEFLNSSTPPGTFIGEITRVKLASEQGKITADEVLKFVKKSLKEFAPLQDEEIVRLVQLVASVDKLEWMVSNIESVGTSVSNKDILYYEIAARSMDLSDYKTAIPLLEKLVENFPYSDQYWAMLSQCQIETQSFEAAEESIDMALAINPGNEMAVNVKMIFLPQNAEALPVLKSMYEHNPANDDVFYRYVTYLTSYGDPDDARKLLAKREIKNPLEQRMVIAYMRLSPEDITKFIKKLPKDTIAAIEPDFWMEIVYGAINAQFYESAVALLIQLARVKVVQFSFDMLMTYCDLLFKTRRFVEVLAVLLAKENFDLCDFTENKIIILVSLIKTGNIAHARELATHWLVPGNFELVVNAPSPGIVAESSVESMFTSICRDIVAMKEKTKQSKLDEYDPLNIWK